eukprot:1885627-Pleurochrysis_carterae.AAC.2
MESSTLSRRAESSTSASIEDITAPAVRELVFSTPLKPESFARYPSSDVASNFIAATSPHQSEVEQVVMVPFRKEALARAVRHGRDLIFGRFFPWLFQKTTCRVEAVTKEHLAGACFAAVGVLICLRARLRPKAALSKGCVKTFIISLDRRPAKRASVVERASSAGLSDIEVISAVDGRALDVSGLRDKGVSLYPFWRLEGSSNRFFRRDIKWGEVGCALSHHAVWRELVARDVDIALILEDDADFAPGFSALMLEACAEAEGLHAAGAIDQPDLMYLARRPMCPHRDVLLPHSVADAGSDKDAFKLCLVRPAFSYKLTAYVLWKRGAEKLLQADYLKKVCARLPNRAVLNINNAHVAIALCCCCSQLIPVDDLLPVLYDRHDAGPNLARPDLDLLYAEAPRLNALAVRPLIAWERRGLSDTENSEEVPLHLCAKSRPLHP